MFGILLIGFILLIGISLFYNLCIAPIKQANAEREALMEKEFSLEYTQEKLAKLFGMDKTYEQQKEIRYAKQEGADAIRQLGTLMQQSVYQEKEHDWAIHGGIANGLAGPIAGIATAINVESKNQKIREENAARREWGKQQKNYMDTLADRLQKEALASEDLKKNLVAIHSWSPVTLFEKIKFSTPKVTQNPQTNSITITTEWTSYDKSICIDGSIRAKIYDKSTKKCVGCAYLNLPVDGTQKGRGKLSGIFTGAQKNCEYTVKLEPADLWEVALIEDKHKETKDGLSLVQHKQIVDKMKADYNSELLG